MQQKIFSSDCTQFLPPGSPSSPVPSRCMTEVFESTNLFSKQLLRLFIRLTCCSLERQTTKGLVPIDCIQRPVAWIVRARVCLVSGVWCLVSGRLEACNDSAKRTSVEAFSGSGRGDALRLSGDAGECAKTDRVVRLICFDLFDYSPVLISLRRYLRQTLEVT